MPTLPYLSQSLVLYVLDKRATLLYHVLQGEKNLPEYRTKDNGSYTVNSVLCSETQTKNIKLN